MTLTLLAFDAEHDQMGGVTFSMYPGVAGVVLRAQPGAGVLATQYESEPVLLAQAVADLMEGLPAREVLERLKAQAVRPERIQAGCIDRHGAMAHSPTSVSGSDEVHIQGETHLVIANTVVAGAAQELDRAFRALIKDGQSLTDALMGAARAADAAGGDKRGRLAAGLRVTSIRNAADYGVDLRVDAADQPLDELAVLVRDWAGPSVSS